MARPTFTLLLLLLLAVLSVVAAASSHPVKKASTAKRASGPQPSRRMGMSRGASSKGTTQEQKQVRPVSRKDFSSFLCPGGATACPVPAPGSDRSTATEADLQQIATWLAGGFECIPTDEELDSCGGCLSLGQGLVSKLLFSHLASSVCSSEADQRCCSSALALADKIARRYPTRATSRVTGARASSSAARRASSSAPTARAVLVPRRPARATSRPRRPATPTKSPTTTMQPGREGLLLLILPLSSRSHLCFDLIESARPLSFGGPRIARPPSNSHARRKTSSATTLLSLAAPNSSHS